MFICEAEKVGQAIDKTQTRGAANNVRTPHQKRSLGCVSSGEEVSQQLTEMEDEPVAASYQ
jgi:hypothetical protein